MKVIRDSIHGNIELTPLEVAVIDTPEMQRLRYVRQLSLAYLVYPSALHTRFEHSFGTMHLTKQLSGRLFEDAAEKQLLSLSALLHDVGHSAFSHLPEELIMGITGKSHEKMGEEKILSGSIASVLENHGVSPRELVKFMKGSKAKIISSELGTDRMDYLLRDAYFTGVAYSVVDAQRLLLSLTYEKGALSLEEKGILAAESLLVSRYLMFNAVYNHHAVRIAAAMLNKGLEIALREKKLSVMELTEGMDDVVLYKLRDNPLIAKVIRRDLYKAAFEKPNFEIKDEARLEKEINSAMLKEFGDSEFVICAPKQSMGAISMPVIFEDGNVADFSKVSRISQAVAMQRKASGVLVAVPREKVKAASKILIKFR